MYTDMYDTFDNEQLTYSYPFSFQDNRLEYMQCTDIPTYEMTRGDTCVFPFRVDSKYQSWIVGVLVYNSRYELVHTFLDYLDDYNQIYLDIDQELSEQVFKQGLYHVQLRANLPLEDGTYKTVTLISAEDCSIRVR